MDMIAPFYKFGLFGFDVSLIVALFIGIAFGFFLERGGLGNARKLAAQFYLTDLTVFKVMFTAVITAMLGLFWFSRLGLLDISLVFINPTYVLPQLLAGLLFGVGFVTGGLCPGTSCVALTTGKIDGLVTLLGIFAGIFIFGELFQEIGGFFYANSLGSITMPQLLHMPHGVILLIVVVIALVGFAGAESLETRMPFVRYISAWKTAFSEFTFHKKLVLIALIPALLAAVIGPPDAMRTRFKVDGITIRYLDSLTLAEWIMEKRDDFSLVDLRPEAEFEEYHIPFAQQGSRIVESEELLNRSKVVLYAMDGTIPEETWLPLRERIGGKVFLLKGGLRTWGNEILFPDLSEAGQAGSPQLARRIRISRFFGGEPIGIDDADAQAPKKYSREGC
jgi:rhodanese-related sulfurtransferase